MSFKRYHLDLQLALLPIKMGFGVSNACFEKALGYLNNSRFIG